MSGADSGIRPQLPWQVTSPHPLHRAAAAAAASTAAEIAGADAPETWLLALQRHCAEPLCREDQLRQNSRCNHRKTTRSSVSRVALFPRKYAAPADAFRSVLFPIPSKRSLASPLVVRLSSFCHLPEEAIDLPGSHAPAEPGAAISAPLATDLPVPKGWLALQLLFFAHAAKREALVLSVRGQLRRITSFPEVRVTCDVLRRASTPRRSAAPSR